jgi:hypothetical protein
VIFDTFLVVLSELGLFPFYLISLLSFLNWERNKLIYKWKINAAYYKFMFVYGREDFDR